MNSYLEKLSFRQLLDLFVNYTREFISGIESERSYKQLQELREQIRSISEVIEAKRSQVSEGRSGDHKI